MYGIKWYNLHVKYFFFLRLFSSVVFPFAIHQFAAQCHSTTNPIPFNHNHWLLLALFISFIHVIYTLSARPKLLKWIWLDDVTLLILLILLLWVGLFILLLLAFNLNLFVLELALLQPPLPIAPLAAAAASNGVVADGAVDGVKWYAEFCTDVQLPSSFDLINNGCSIFRPLSQPPKLILSHRPLFGKRFRLDVPANLKTNRAMRNNQKDKS